MPLPSVITASLKVYHVFKINTELRGKTGVVVDSDVVVVVAKVVIVVTPVVVDSVPGH